MYILPFLNQNPQITLVSIYQKSGLFSRVTFINKSTYFQPLIEKILYLGQTCWLVIAF